MSRWMEAFPESDHGPVWLKALEAGYHTRLLNQMMNRPVSQSDLRDGASEPPAPLFAIGLLYRCAIRTVPSPS